MGVVVHVIFGCVVVPTSLPDCRSSPGPSDGGRKHIQFE